MAAKRAAPTIGGTVAKKAKKTYKQWFQDDMAAALQELHDYHFRPATRGQKDTKAPSFRHLENKYGPPFRTISNYWDVLVASTELGTAQLRPTDTTYLGGTPGWPSIVPAYIRERLAGFISWADTPACRRQVTVEERGPALLCMIDEHNARVEEADEN